jgi:hypothetical protein
MGEEPLTRRSGTTIGGSDGYVRSFDYTGTASATFTVGTRRDDTALWTAGGGGSLVVVGFTAGWFPSEPDPGGYDAFALHVSVP